MNQTRPLAAVRAQWQAGIDAATNLEGFLTAAKKILDEFPELRVAFAAEFRLLADGCPPAAPVGRDVLEVDSAPHENKKETKPATVEPSAPNDEDSGTAAARVVVFFQTRNNEPASLAEIVAGTACPESTIKSVVYKRNKDAFTTRRKPGDRKSYWMLRRETETITESESATGATDGAGWDMEERKAS